MTKPGIWLTKSTSMLAPEVMDVLPLPLPSNDISITSYHQRLASFSAIVDLGILENTLQLVEQLLCLLISGSFERKKGML